MSNFFLGPNFREKITLGSVQPFSLPKEESKEEPKEEPKEVENKKKDTRNGKE